MGCLFVVVFFFTKKQYESMRTMLNTNIFNLKQV